VAKWGEGPRIIVNFLSVEGARGGRVLIQLGSVKTCSRHTRGKGVATTWECQDLW
jgi:hypothetical protein